MEEVLFFSNLASGEKLVWAGYQREDEVNEEERAPTLINDPAINSK